MHRELVKTILSSAAGIQNPFDAYIGALEHHFERPVHSLSELRTRENKKLKGDEWELFCRDWLLSGEKYRQVWLLKDCPHLPMLGAGASATNQDIGIDLIAETLDGKFCAVQCKYRKPTGRSTNLDWKTLSTFFALCARSGPPGGWDKYIVMTNCRGIARKAPRSPKDLSICLQSFRGTGRERWLRMIGLCVEHRTSDSRTITSNTPLDAVDTLKELENFAPNPQVALQSIRDARLRYFCPTNSAPVLGFST